MGLGDHITPDFEGDRWVDRCGVCGASGVSLWQMSCARPVCTQKHTDDDGEVIDCAVDGPLAIHFNVTRCRKCGGSRAVRKAVTEHQKLCKARHPPAVH